MGIQWRKGGVEDDSTLECVTSHNLLIHRQCPVSVDVTVFCYTDTAERLLVVVSLSETVSV